MTLPADQAQRAITCRAAVLRGFGAPLAVEEVVVPPPGDDVRVRLMASGVCHSDLHVIHGDWDQQRSSRQHATHNSCSPIRANRPIASFSSG